MGLYLSNKNQIINYCKPQKQGSSIQIYSDCIQASSLGFILAKVLDKQSWLFEHSKIILQITKHRRSIMASPYTIRSRSFVSSPISSGQLFKTFDNTPRASSRQIQSFQTNRYQSNGTPKYAEHTTARISKMKAPSTKRIFSQQELSNADLVSNSLNESSLVAEKFRRSDADFQRAQQNLQSVEHEQSFVFAHNSSERQLSQQVEKGQDEENETKLKNRQRAIKSWSCYGVPYRKCHSSMQQKVVAVINKIKSGKECHKQIQTLIEKAKKVSTKQLNNKYFVSGIQLICNLSTDKKYGHIFTPELVRKINEGLEELKIRILAELDNIKGFQAKDNFEQEVTFEKLDLVRTAYRVLRRKLRTQKREEVQNKALQAADWFIQNKVNDLCLFYDELAQC